MDLCGKLDSYPDINLLGLYASHIQGAQQHLYPAHLSTYLYYLSNSIDVGQMKQVVDSIQSQNFTAKEQVLTSSLQLISARLALLSGEAITDDALATLSSLDHAQPIVALLYERFLIDLHSSKNEPGEMYTHLLKFDTARSLGGLSLPAADCRDFAQSLLRVALTSPEVNTFGDVLALPVIDAVVGTEHAYLRTILDDVAAGDVAKTNQDVAASPMAEHASILIGKARAVALMDLVFASDPSDWTFTLDDIAARIAGPVSEAEDVVLKAMMDGLIKGRIHSADGRVAITWLQPRPLTLPQVGTLRDKLKKWYGQVIGANSMVAAAKEKTMQMAAMFEE